MRGFSAAAYLGAALHPTIPHLPASPIPAKNPDRDGRRAPLPLSHLMLSLHTFPLPRSCLRDGSAQGGLLSSRIPPYTQHLLTARPATAPLSAGAGANPIYTPGQARPARMRLRLTPPDSGLNSPARSPARLRGSRAALYSVRDRPPRGPLAQALSPRSPALHFTCSRGPRGGRESLRGSSSLARLPAARLPHLPPVRSCPLPPSTPGFRGCRAAAQHRRTAR